MVRVGIGRRRQLDFDILGSWATFRLEATLVGGVEYGRA
jgi:hypothetical protein